MLLAIVRALRLQRHNTDPHCAKNSIAHVGWTRRVAPHTDDVKTPTGIQSHCNARGSFQCRPHRSASHGAMMRTSLRRCFRKHPDRAPNFFSATCRCLL